MAHTQEIEILLDAIRDAQDTNRAFDLKAEILTAILTLVIGIVTFGGPDTTLQGWLLVAGRATGLRICRAVAEGSQAPRPSGMRPRLRLTVAGAQPRQLAGRRFCAIQLMLCVEPDGAALSR